MEHTSRGAGSDALHESTPEVDLNSGGKPSTLYIFSLFSPLVTRHPESGNFQLFLLSRSLLLCLLVIRIVERFPGGFSVHIHVLSESSVQLVLLLLDVGPELRQRLRHRLIRVLMATEIADGSGGGGPGSMRVSTKRLTWNPIKRWLRSSAVKKGLRVLEFVR